MSISMKLSEWRKAKGWTQAELASQIGISTSRVGHWERGGSVPSARYRKALSSALGIPEDEILLPHQLQPLDITVNLKAVRESYGLSVISLSELSGVSMTVIKTAEAGKTLPNGRSLCMIASALGCTLNDLITINSVQQQGGE